MAATSREGSVISAASSPPAGRVSEPWARRATSALALLAYVALSVVLFGRGVVGSPYDHVIGDQGSDKTIFMWALEWWPRALGDGKDPYSADVVWAPDGMDLSWVAAIPGASYLATPLTLLVGPVATYDVLVLLAPPTAAWAAFVLGRWVTGLAAPAFVSGLLFGFSSFEIGQSIGHLHLTIVLLIPICLLLILRRFAGEISRARFVGFLTLTLSAQFLISTEVFLLLVGVGVVCLALAWWILGRESRPTLRTTTGETTIGLVLTAAVVSPYLVHAFVLTGPSWAPTRNPFDAAADLANFVVPRRWTWLRPPGGDELAQRFTANPVESTAYLGLPLVLVVVLFALRRGRPRAHVLLLAALAATVVLSLGAWIRLAGTTVALGPDQIFSRLPVMQNALPVRLTLFVALFAALVCALWLAERTTSIFRWLMAAASVVALLPTPSTAFWTADVERVRFFADGHVNRRFDRDDIVLVLPYGRSGWSMLWQAEAGFGFRMVGGRLGNLPPDEERWLPVLRALADEGQTSEATRMFPGFLAEHEVDAIVVAPGTHPGPRRLVERLGIEPSRTADALIYEIPMAKSG